MAARNVHRPPDSCRRLARRLPASMDRCWLRSRRGGGISHRVAMLPGAFPQPQSSRDRPRGRVEDHHQRPLPLFSHHRHDRDGSAGYAPPGWSAGQADRPRPKLTQSRIDVRPGSSLPTVHLPPADGSSRSQPNTACSDPGWPMPRSLRGRSAGGDVLVVPLG